MSTVVSQNLTESAAAAIKLKPAPPPDSRDRSTNQELGNRGFDFLQTTPKYESTFFSLSAKSLEMCTEHLGSETGCDSASAASPPSNSTPRYKGDGGNKDSILKRATRLPKSPVRKFPPPLTSSLQVRRRSEGGRVIIEATEAPLGNSFMQAERRDGRLRICFLTADTTAGEEEEWDRETAAEKELELREEIELDGDVKKSFEVEVESEKYQRASRCKEEDGHRNQWKRAVWVATS